MLINGGHGNDEVDDNRADDRDGDGEGDGSAVSIVAIHMISSVL